MTKNYAQALGARLLSGLGIPWIGRVLLARHGGFALVIHDVIQQRRPDMSPESQYGITEAELEQILKWISKRFQFLTPHEFLNSTKSGVLLTIDDGKSNNYQRALPILERYEAPALFFITTQHVLNPRDWLAHTKRCARTQWSDLEDVPDDIAWEYYNGMSASQLAACSKHPLITLGAHTVSHPFLTTCDQVTLNYELVESRKSLEELADTRVDLFAYPTGDYNAQVAEAVRNAGYKYAFALNSKHVAPPRYEIPRIYLRFSHPYYLDVKFSGFYSRPVRFLN